MRKKVTGGGQATLSAIYAGALMCQGGFSNILPGQPICCLTMQAPKPTSRSSLLPHTLLHVPAQLLPVLRATRQYSASPSGTQRARSWPHRPRCSRARPWVRCSSARCKCGWHDCWANQSEVIKLPIRLETTVYRKGLGSFASACAHIIYLCDSRVASQLGTAVRTLCCAFQGTCLCPGGDLGRIQTA